MQKTIKTLAAVASITVATVASAQVTTNIYTGFSEAGDGTPFSGLVGTLQTPGITFGTDTGFNWHPFGLSAFGSQSTAVINVASAGSYLFGLNSDDGSSLYIDGVRIIDNGGSHAPQLVTGTATLSAGSHSFTVNFFEDFGGPSGLDLTLLPTGVVFAVPEPSAWVLMSAGLLAIGAFARRRQRG